MGQKNQLWWDLPAQESFRLHQQIYRIDPQQFERTRDELSDLSGEIRHHVAETHRQYRRDLVPVRNTVAVFVEAKRRTGKERS